MKRHKVFFILVFTFCMVGTKSYADQKDDKNSNRPKVLKIEGKTYLPLRVLTRPNSKIYKEPKDDVDNINTDNVRAFQRYYVYTRPKQDITSTEAKGWYQIGDDNRGNIIGWVKAEDVMEWKHNMCLVFAHPEGRKRVLMFNELGALRDLVKFLDDERIKQAEEYYKKIETKYIPKDFPITAIEPDGAIDITKQFYLLPILESAPIEIGENEIEGNLLKIASCPKRRRDVIVRFKSPLKLDIAGRREEILKGLKMDIVYVMDMTSSMQPYIDITRNVLMDISGSIAQDAEINKCIRFGLWGYRDSTEIKGMEFVARNFAEELQDVDGIVDTLFNVKASTVESADYAEDVFFGMNKAMTETNWTEDAMRIIILVGDAPGHEAGHRWNLSGQTADTLRIFADDNRHTVLTLHIKDKKAKEYWELTEEQFRTLSRNMGGGSSYFSIDSDDTEGFAKTLLDINTEVVDTIGLTKERENYTQVTGSSANTLGDATTTSGNAIKESMVNWAGSQYGTQAPRDIIAWITDRDLIDPDIPSLDVKVLINRSQLDQLKVILGELIGAAKAGKIRGGDLFDALQAVSVTTCREPDHIKHAQTLAEAGVIPEFMQGLPYKSLIMSLNSTIWSSWSDDHQNSFIDELQVKIELYRSIHDSPEGWVQLNEGDNPDDHVYLLPLEALP